jgi:AraC-like DNA-binding protein
MSFNTFSGTVQTRVAAEPDSARQYLNEQSIFVDVVAELLGYSEAANFRRAFKRWHGATPQQYRESKLSYRSHQQKV